MLRTHQNKVLDVIKQTWSTNTLMTASWHVVAKLLTVCRMWTINIKCYRNVFLEDLYFNDLIACCLPLSSQISYLILILHIVENGRLDHTPVVKVWSLMETLGLYSKWDQRSADDVPVTSQAACCSISNCLSLIWTLQSKWSAWDLMNPQRIISVISLLI